MRSGNTTTDINLRSSNEFWIGAATRTIFLTLPDHRVEWKRPICFKLDASPFVRTISHPRLKTPMRLVDHLYFVAEHDDHHLSRIWELVTTKQSLNDANSLPTGRDDDER